MDIRSVALHRAAYSPKDFPRDGRPQFAVVGRSNVGKSTFINTVLGHGAVARVSQTPGKTQAIHFYLVNERFYIVDLPGYGYAKVPRAIVATWRDLIGSYFQTADALRLVFLLIDSRRTPGEEDLMMRDWLSEAGRKWRAVMTKTDKLSGNELAKARRELAAEYTSDTPGPIAFSKITRRGLDEIWREITAGLGAGKQERETSSTRVES